MTSRGVRSTRDGRLVEGGRGRRLQPRRRQRANLAQATMHPTDGRADGGRTATGPSLSINLVVRSSLPSRGRRTKHGGNVTKTHNNRPKDERRRRQWHCAKSNVSLKHGGRLLRRFCRSYYFEGLYGKRLSEPDYDRWPLTT